MDWSDFFSNPVIWLDERVRLEVDEFADTDLDFEVALPLGFDWTREEAEARVLFFSFLACCKLFSSVFEASFFGKVEVRRFYPCGAFFSDF